jgi:TPR repeat protein
MNARTTLETSVVASTAADGWLSTCLAARGHSCAPQWTSTSDGDLASVDSATTTRFSARVVAGASAARAMSVTALLLALVVVFVLPWALILTSEFYLRGILLPRDDERSFVLMRRAADLGNVEAMTDLAKKFAIGEGTRIDYGAARRWYMLATDRGSTRAMLGLGAMAEQGQGEPVNRGKAAKLWGQAAALGNARAMFLLGARHQEGGSSSDLVQARQWYERSTAGGDRYGARALALMLSSGVGGPADVPRARTLLERTGAVLDLAALDQRGDNGPQGLVAARRTFEMAARFGSSVAMHNLGVMYETGRGAAKDANEAASWYLRAAKAGNKTSMRYLGSFYQAVEHLDYRAARLWHERAAELGNTDSMVDLGAMALYGRGGVQDYATSRRWFERAASGGNVLGLHNLGILHYNGQGVSRDMVAARGYFQKAAQRGSPHAMRQLASMYRHGQGVERRLATAVELYEKAAALGDTDAMVELGIMFSESFSAMRDARRARTWFERAASKGSARGARNLGVFYREGHGVTVDLAVARSWFEKAAAAGDGDAMNDLADLFLRGAGVRQDYVVAGQWRDRAAQLTETTTGMASLAANWTGGTATQEALEAKFVGMLSARPRDADLHHEFAFELERNGHLEPAIEHYSLATRLPPRAIGRAFLYRDLANALLRRGDVPGATAALRKSVVSWPVKGRGSCNATEVQLLGNVLEQSGALGDAMKYWRERMTLDPADEVCIAQYYRLLAKAKRLGEGLHDVEAAR